MHTAIYPGGPPAMRCGYWREEHRPAHRFAYSKGTKEALGIVRLSIVRGFRGVPSVAPVDEFGGEENDDG